MRDNQRSEVNWQHIASASNACPNNAWTNDLFLTAECPVARVVLLVSVQADQKNSDRFFALTFGPAKNWWTTLSHPCRRTGVNVVASTASRHFVDFDFARACPKGALFGAPTKSNNHKWSMYPNLFTHCSMPMCH